MTVSLQKTIQHFDRWLHTDTNDISVAKDEISFLYSLSITNGSGNNQMQDQFADERTVSPGEGNDDILDLAGVLVDRFGNTLTFATIKQLVVINDATDSGEDLRVGGPSEGTTGSLISSLFDGDTGAGIVVKAGGKLDILAPLAGYTVTATTADKLVITNRGTEDITYRIIIAGTR